MMQEENIDIISQQNRSNNTSAPINLIILATQQLKLLRRVSIKSMTQNDFPVHAIQLLGLILDLGTSLMESYRTTTPDVCVRLDTS